jgi:hypothetical protein
MRIFRATPHAATLETPNFMMLGREARLPDDLLHEVPPVRLYVETKYANDLQECLRLAHVLLREHQDQLRVEDTEEPPLYAVGDLV